MPKPPAVPDRSTDNGSGGGPLQPPLRELGILAKLAMKRQPFHKKFTVFACYAASVVSLVVITTPPYSAGKQEFSFVLLLAFLALALGLVWWSYGAGRGRRRQDVIGGMPGRRAHPWYERVPTNPVLAETVEGAIIQTLTDSREAAFGFLRSVNPELELTQVRANIFLPTRARFRNAVTLGIYPGLHVNMNDSREREIRFNPGQGVTGRVFESGKPDIALRLASNQGDWDESYDITPELARLINKDLKWIISMPLWGDRGVVGVMNVDGLVQQFEYDRLRACRDKCVLPHTLVAQDLIQRGMVP